jgi:hypothetical protein
LNAAKDCRGRGRRSYKMGEKFEVGFLVLSDIAAESEMALPFLFVSIENQHQYFLLLDSMSIFPILLEKVRFKGELNTVNSHPYLFLDHRKLGGEN